VSSTPTQTDGQTSQAQDKAQQAAGQAKDKAQQVAGQASGRVREQIDQRSTQAGQQVTSTANDTRQIAQQLREQGKEQPAKLAEQAADRVESLGNYLERSDGDRILHDVEDFGRRQPMAVMLGGLALGFAASRFLKASSERRQSPSQGSGSSQGYSSSYGYESPPVTAPTRNTATTRDELGGETPPVPTRPATGIEPAPVTPDVSLTGGVQPVRRSP
jgi:hypothetical protein